MKKRINWAEILSAHFMGIVIIAFWIFAIWYTRPCNGRKNRLLDKNEKPHGGIDC